MKNRFINEKEKLYKYHHRMNYMNEIHLGHQALMQSDDLKINQPVPLQQYFW